VVVDFELDSTLNPTTIGLFRKARSMRRQGREASEIVERRETRFTRGGFLSGKVGNMKFTGNSGNLY
tara:strand:+ start:120 stop:320 length:201 start_codon:yes stop_codon:yes gene_type:complete